MKQKRIKVRLTKNSPYSEFGYYEEGDIGYIDGYTENNAIVILENGRFAKADLRWIEVVNEEDNNVNIELNESEDERIKKEIIAFITTTPKARNSHKKWIAWLEKQGESKPIGKLQLNEELYEHIRNTCACIDDALSSETLADTKDYLSMAKHSAQSAFDMIEKQDSQNLDNSAKTCKDEQQPTNKVEQEFNVGDWIVKNDGNDCFSDGSYVLQIEGVYDEGYTLSNNNFLREPFFQTYRLWTIQDAKEGDLLADDYGIYIFEKFDECDENCFVCIGAYQYSKKIYECEHMLCSVEVHPATKEQRDLLFQKMREAGYEWDAEKKELTKIEEKSIEKPTKGNYYTCIKDYEFCEHDDMTFEMGKIYKCEEDGKITADNGGLWPFRDITGFFRLSTHEEISSHIKKSVEWSEGDEAMLVNLVAWIEGKWGTLGGKVGGKEAYISFLKSIQERYTWKPSDEQMKALGAVVVDAGYKNDISTSGYKSYTHLCTLLRDLKKLREG